MESPVVVDKPPEYHGNAGTNEDRGFPFEEEEGGAWSDLAARHPDIAARLRHRPAATWARKRRPSNHNSDDFGGFDRFPFDDIPPQFREHLPTHWSRRFDTQEQPQPQPQSPTQTASTQTEDCPTEIPQSLPQYGLRNTVDLGQKSEPDPSLVDGEGRSQRCMSAPPESRSQGSMSSPGQEPEPSGVRHIPIFVEGRDQPVLNTGVDRGTSFGDSKPHPPQPHIDREQYFNEDPISFHQPPNFTRSFGGPSLYRQTQGQPFVYPNAFARGVSPQRSQSPKPAPQDDYRQIPVQHERGAAKPKPQQPQPQQQKPQQPQPHPQKPQQPHPQPQHQKPQQPQPQQQKPQQPQPPPQQQQQHEQQAAPKQATPPPPPRTPADPITQILAIQTDVLNLMTEVEKFAGAKNDKQYLYLDEMLTRNLIKLDNIETEGKENIRTARKEAIKCIQKCISVLEAKAESNRVQKEKDAAGQQNKTENGEVEIKETPKEETKAAENSELEMNEAKTEPSETPPNVESQTQPGEKPQTEPATAPQVADTRPSNAVTKEQDTDKKTKKGKNAKKHDQSNDKSKDSAKEEKTSEENSSSTEKQSDVNGNASVDTMQVDEKGEKLEQNAMDVDAAASQ